MNRQTRIRLAMLLLLHMQQQRRALLLLLALSDQRATAVRLAARVAASRGEMERDRSYWTQTVPAMSDEQFKQNFRVSRQDFDYLCALLGPDWQPRLGAIDVRQALALFLSRLSTQATLRETANQFGVCRATAYATSTAMARLIVRRMSRLIQCPRTAADWKTIGRRWNARSKVANPVAAIDGTHNAQPLRFGLRQVQMRKLPNHPQHVVFDCTLRFVRFCGVV